MTPMMIIYVFFTIFPFLEIEGLIDDDVCDGVFDYEYLLFMRSDDMFIWWLVMIFAMVYLIMNTCCLCEVMTYLCDVNKYGEVDFMSIVMSDDDMLLCGL